ncbi:HAD family phosphatase [Vibrio gazogenes]|uniref:Putative hydrolase of the HAD superfamily n=1 Tax=Vibrio gazogenes DSM 21264 = NBRC 103151 TaxID=1123492 RepID=A0A1M4UYS0_VIBGA|nr:HAD family phosphatase [Vibrio gazogenes]USP15651.1 HAD family phosphatase [Vibrio gazogenes]SHE61825.1 putative hydrolase of the HAD superfamily [Vibrio gazogenes DSM 21264] [Vibrio gazogenes DSM 21264 = NBRC 103151]SJN58101.1 Alpha-D-glucose-1-phosphate phosphatase YihX [Vibrio gazogenes]
MTAVHIKNVVFDIGNVVVRWDPLAIIRLTFDDSDAAEEQAKSIFQSETWLSLNKGLITENEAKAQYKETLGLTALECERLFYYVKQTQILIYGSVDLIKRCKSAGYHVLALTDNVHEIISYLKATYTFWDLFDGATVSAEVGLLKPQPEIYRSLLSQYGLKASETVFIDDMPYNVKGAESVGMTAIQFKNAAQCEQALKSCGVRL